MSANTRAGQMTGPVVERLKKAARVPAMKIYRMNVTNEYNAILELNLRTFSREVPSCDGDNFVLFFLNSRVHHLLLRNQIYNSFPVKDLSGFTAFAGPLRGNILETRCQTHLFDFDAFSGFTNESRIFVNDGGIELNYSERVLKMEVQN